jgi:hypothetical protein
MNYAGKLLEMRDNMHRDIVQEATVRNAINGNESDGVLLFKRPLVIRGNVVASVCCETGLLILDDNDTLVKYKDFSIEELAVLHRTIVETKQYTFTLNSQLV